mmetsp:Transcript_32567/g.71475  ORF Transcript_32567/g.71475 Transcript_32567/m.71475 type:complete len:381 (+) Transcript_32567:266-1408(+)
MDETNVWAKVVSALPFRDALNCSVLSRSFLREVAPRVDTLSIERPAELHVILARRFSGVSTVGVSCFYECAPEVLPRNRHKVSVSPNTVDRVIPFLQCFPHLAKINLHYNLHYQRGFCEHNRTVSRDFKDPLLAWFFRSVSGAYRSGALQQQAKVDDAMIFPLFCRSVRPNADAITNRPYADDCDLCRTMCESFPIEDVLFARCKSTDYRIYGFCLTPGLSMTTISKRRGADALLKSKETFLTFLGDWAVAWFDDRDNPSWKHLERDHPDLYDSEEDVGSGACIRYCHSTVAKVSWLCNNGYFDPTTLDCNEIMEKAFRSDSLEDYEISQKNGRLAFDGASFDALRLLGIPLGEHIFVRVITDANPKGGYVLEGGGEAHN